MWNYYNHGGALPCKHCSACLEHKVSMDRLTAWIEATKNGADPRR